MTVQRAKLPETAILGGIAYSVCEHEGLIVFSSGRGFWGVHTRIAFQRKAGIWYVSTEDTFGATVVGHIEKAYAIVCEVYGGNFEFKNGEDCP